MTLAPFIARRTPILLDGAMGTQLAAAGLEMGGWYSASHPDAVGAVHTAYAAAGSEILIANTLSMNRIFIETHTLGVDVAHVNRCGVRLARSAAAGGPYVLGDVGTTGQILEPYGDCPETRVLAAFREQAEHLLAAGVDGFIVETMLDLREAVCAVRACREVGALPVLATLAFQTTDNGGRTLMGNSARESAAALADAGAAAIGANCGSLDPYETAQIIGTMRDCTDLPLIAKPNAGKPRLVEGETVFDMGPAPFAEGIAACLAAGATLVGGCCGTTPAHIRRLKDMLTEDHS
ncbi:MAG: homocysteine S-methyltransferase family protein [Kiritimatiellae bacterium]|nr:homocysteine S-methyltransferase family protein [Kiritimatiellia bacterium]